MIKRRKFTKIKRNKLLERSRSNSMIKKSNKKNKNKLIYNYKIMETNRYESIEVSSNETELIKNQINETRNNAEYLLAENEIQNQTKDSLNPLTEDTHLLLEHELWELFWISANSHRKLEADFTEPFTMASVLSVFDEEEIYA